MAFGRHPLALLLVVLFGLFAASTAFFLTPPAARPPSTTAAAAARPSPSRTARLAVAAGAGAGQPAAAASGAGAGAGTPAAAAAARRPRREVKVLNVIESPGGYMSKVEVHNFAEKSSHTVIVSKELFAETCALAGKETDGDSALVEDYFKAVFKFVMAKGMPLQNTEGMLTAELFPVNLFTVSQLSIYLDGVTEGVAEILKEM